jgi:hypothetical protein
MTVHAGRCPETRPILGPWDSLPPAPPTITISAKPNRALAPTSDPGNAANGWLAVASALLFRCPIAQSLCRAWAIFTASMDLAEMCSEHPVRDRPPACIFTQSRSAGWSEQVHPTYGTPSTCCHPVDSQSSPVSLSVHSTVNTRRARGKSRT